MDYKTDIEFTGKCQEISGFGGSYEEACRKMVIAGYKWLMAHPLESPRIGTYSNIYGITIPVGHMAKEFQQVMADIVGGDCTGAMMQACTSHAFKARSIGWEAYIKLMEES